MFYLSDYLESHRDEYYNRLSQPFPGKATGRGGSVFSASHYLAGKKQCSACAAFYYCGLYEQTKDQMRELTHSQHTTQLVDTLLMAHFRVSDFVQRSGINKPTLHGLLRQLMQPAGPLTMLKEGAGRRPAIYAFPQLLNICEGKPVLPENPR